jgi:hypothetical protein
VNSVPDGVQFAFAGDSTSPATLFQDLGLPVAPGVTYEIDIFVGSRVEGIAAQYRIELDAGSTPIGSLSGTISPGTGDFIPVTLTAIGAGTGDLGIRLSETGFGQSLFDDVRVTAFSVPEPSSLMLVAGAAVGALAATCRRARTAVRPQGGDAS